MKVGQMKDRITIQSKKDQTSAVVDLSDSNYTDYDTIWSKIEYAGMNEAFKADADNIVNTINFITRYRTDIKGNMRIMFSDDYYEIKGFRPLTPKKMYLVITGKLIEHEGGK